MRVREREELKGRMCVIERVLHKEVILYTLAALDFLVFCVIFCAYCITHAFSELYHTTSPLKHLCVSWKAYVIFMYDIAGEELKRFSGKRATCRQKCHTPSRSGGNYNNNSIHKWDGIYIQICTRRFFLLVQRVYKEAKLLDVCSMVLSSW